MDETVLDNRWKKWGGVFCGYVPPFGTAFFYALILFILSTSIDLQTQLIGNNIDNWIFYWNNWWLRTALSEGVSPFFTDRMFAPNGTSLALHSFSYTTSLMVGLVAPFRGSVFAHNLIVFVRLWLGGMGMYVLVKGEGGRAWGAFVAGLVFMLAPYHITKILSHDNLSTIQFWPWYVWALGQLLRTEQKRFMGLAGLFLALSIWGGLHLALMLAMLTLFYVAISWQEWTQLKRFGLLVGTAIVALLLVSPYVVVLFNARDLLGTASADFSEAALKQTDLLAYLIPTTYQPLWGEAFRGIHSNFEVNRVFMVFLGYTPLALVLYGAVKLKKVRAWLLGIGIWMVLALGTMLRVNGRLFDLPILPYRWLGSQFPLSALRSPDRLNLLVVFTLALMVGLAVSHLLERQKTLWKAASTALLSLLIIAEFWIWPLPSWPVPADAPIFAELAQTSDDRAVLHYPMGYSNSKRWLYYQTLHERPIVSGHMSRFSNETYQFIRENESVRALHDDAEQPSRVTIPPSDGTFSVDSLLENGVGILVHHRRESSDAEKERLKTLLPNAPIYRDDTFEVFDLAVKRPFSITPEIHTHSVQAIFADTYRLNEVSWEMRGSELRLDLLWELSADSIGNYKTFIHLINENGQLVRQYDAVPCNWTCPTIDWQPNTQINDVGTLELFDLPSGTYTIRIGLYETAPLLTDTGNLHAEAGHLTINR